MRKTIPQIMHRIVKKKKNQQHMNDSAISPNLGLVKKLLLVLPGKLYVLFTLFQNEQASGEKIKTPVEKRKLYML